MKQNIRKNERLSTSQKNASKKQWYKDKANELDSDHSSLRESMVKYLITRECKLITISLIIS